MFHNFDSRVYYTWTNYFGQAGNLPYYDHPPLMFLLESALLTLWNFLNQLLNFNSLLYLLLLVPVSFLIFEITKKQKIHFTILTITIFAYAWSLVYFSHLYEFLTILTLVSGLFEIYLVYKLGQTLFNEKIGLISAFLMAVSWWHIVYSRILLIDGLALTLTTWAVLEYVKFLKKDTVTKKSFIWPIVATTLCFYSKYYTLLTAIPLLLFTFIQKKSFKKSLKYLLPLSVSFLAFGVWLLFSGFNLMHYAGSHYYFLVFPGLFAFLNFLFKVLTPLLFALFLVSIVVVLYQRKHLSEVALLLSLVFIPFAIYFSFTYWKGLSHTLINLSNYMLFCLPFILIIIALGWYYLQTKITIEESTEVLVLIGTTSLLMLVSTPLLLEYGTNYQSVKGNLNPLSSQQLEQIEVPNSFRHHYIYKFHSVPVFIHNSVEKRVYYRWISPSKMRIISLNQKEVKLKLKVIRLSQEKEISITLNNTTILSDELLGENEVVDIKLELKAGVNYLKFRNPSRKPNQAELPAFSIKRI